MSRFQITRCVYFPSLLEPRRRAEKALASVVQEAYVKGVSTRKVDDLVRALGMDGICKSEVSRICKALDHDVEAFRNRPIEEDMPYVWLDATFHKVRDFDKVMSVACVVAIGVSISGEGRCWAWTAVPLKTMCFGPTSCAASSNAASKACACDI